jgi:hypothetical protein
MMGVLMSLNNFIAQLWADSLLASLRKDLVYGNLFNSDYQGIISQMGDTVKINAIGDILISSYVKDTDMTAPQTLTDAQTMLVISQGKYYNFEVDDVDQAQAEPGVMGEAMAWAAYKIALTMDLYFAGFYTDCIAANTIGSSASPVVPVVASNANIGLGTTVYDYLVVLAQYLTQQAVPRQGRWCVIPPWVKTYLTQDIRFTSFNTPQARATIATGNLDASGGNAVDAYLGRVENMDVYESVNAPNIGGTPGITGSQDVVLAGHSMALTKAVGINKVEAYRPPYRFADAVKGLCLYGAKTIRPYALAVAYLQHP